MHKIEFINSLISRVTRDDGCLEIGKYDHDILRDLLDEATQYDNKRTIAQNSAMHKWFQHVADMINDAGYDVRTFFKEHISIPFTPQIVKDEIWRKIQVVMFDKESTTQLTKPEVSEVEKVVARALAEKGIIPPPFPSQENKGITNDDY